MTGETALNKLIKNVQPQLNEGKFVFVSLVKHIKLSLDEVVCTFREEEGLTVVLEKDKADKLKLEYNFIAAWITLNVHSSLEAVGLTSKVADALTQEGISCNAVAAYYHDHVFVPFRKASRAMAVLRNLG